MVVLKVRRALMASIPGSNVVNFNSFRKLGPQFRHWSPLCAGVGLGRAWPRIGRQCTLNSSYTMSGNQFFVLFYVLKTKINKKNFSKN